MTDKDYQRLQLSGRWPQQQHRTLPGSSTRRLAHRRCLPCTATRRFHGKRPAGMTASTCSDECQARQRTAEWCPARGHPVAVGDLAAARAHAGGWPAWGRIPRLERRLRRSRCSIEHAQRPAGSVVCSRAAPRGEQPPGRGSAPPPPHTRILHPSEPPAAPAAPEDPTARALLASRAPAPPVRQPAVSSAGRGSPSSHPRGGRAAKRTTSFPAAAPAPLLPPEVRALAAA